MFEVRVSDKTLDKARYQIDMSTTISNLDFACDQRTKNFTAHACGHFVNALVIFLF